MRYGSVYIRHIDEYEVLQYLENLLGPSGTCRVSGYTPQLPEKTGPNKYRIDILSNGGYYVTVEIVHIEPDVFRADVLGSDLGLASGQDSLARKILENLQRQRYGLL